MRTSVDGGANSLSVLDLQFGSLVTKLHIVFDTNSSGLQVYIDVKVRPKQEDFQNAYFYVASLFASLCFCSVSFALQFLRQRK